MIKAQSIFFTLVLLFIFRFSYAQETQVYGYLSGQPGYQLLSLSQIDDIETSALGGVPTWLALISKLDTNNPEVHFIDTNHFSSIPSQYGTHQAYSDEMGITQGSADFIRSMKGLPGEPRSLMAFTLYIPSQEAQSPNGFSAQWVLQNRRYVFKDSSDSFTKSLIKAQKAIRNAFSKVNGKPLFVTYKKANSHRRPNRLTQVGKTDIQSFKTKGFGTLTEEELSDQQ